MQRYTHSLTRVDKYLLERMLLIRMNFHGFWEIFVLGALNISRQMSFRITVPHNHCQDLRPGDTVISLGFPVDL